MQLLSLVLAYSFLLQYATYFSLDDQLSDFLTKPLAHASFQFLYFKLRMFDLYDPTLGGVLELLSLFFYVNSILY